MSTDICKYCGGDFHNERKQKIEVLERLFYNNEYLKLLLKSKKLSVGTAATVKEVIYWNDKVIKSQR